MMAWWLPATAHILTVLKLDSALWSLDSVLWSLALEPERFNPCGSYEEASEGIRAWAGQRGAVHASHGRLIIAHNGGMTFVERVADAEDDIIGRDNGRCWGLDVGIFSASWVTGATPRPAVAPRH